MARKFRAIECCVEATRRHCREKIQSVHRMLKIRTEDRVDEIQRGQYEFERTMKWKSNPKILSSAARYRGARATSLN